MAGTHRKMGILPPETVAGGWEATAGGGEGWEEFGWCCWPACFNSVFLNPFCTRITIHGLTALHIWMAERTEIGQKGDPRANRIYQKWSGMKLFREKALLTLAPHEIYLKCKSIHDME